MYFKVLIFKICWNMENACFHILGYWKHHAVYLCICISVLLLLHHAFCIFVTGQHQVEKVWFHILGSKAPCGQFDSNDWCVLTHKEFPCRQNTAQSRSVELLFYCSYVDDNLRCVVLWICVFVFFVYLCFCVFFFVYLSPTLLLQMLIWGMLEASCAVDSMWRKRVKTKQYTMLTSTFLNTDKRTVQRYALTHQ